jgi:hypothetical protein
MSFRTLAICVRGHTSVSFSPGPGPGNGGLPGGCDRHVPLISVDRKPALRARTECFDDYFPCTRINWKLEHITNWSALFADMHNRDLFVKQKIIK